MGSGKEKVEVKIEREDSLVDGKEGVEFVVNITVLAGAMTFSAGRALPDVPAGLGAGSGSKSVTGIPSAWRESY